MKEVKLAQEQECEMRENEPVVSPVEVVDDD